MNTCKQMYETFSKLLTNTKQKAFYDWMLENGKEFKGRILTRVECKRLQDEVPRKLFTAGLCIYQSQMGAIGNNFRYFEGQASTQSLEIPLEHAWLVDKEDKVWDTTWKDGLDYFGVEIPTPFIRKNILKTKEAQGLLAKYYGEVVLK